MLLFRPVDPPGPLALLPPDVCSQGQRSPWLPPVGCSLTCPSPFRPLQLGSPDLWAGLMPPPGQSCGSGTTAWGQGPSEARSENKWPIATQLQEEKAIVFQPESKGFVPGNQPVWQNLTETSVQLLLSQISRFRVSATTLMFQEFPSMFPTHLDKASPSLQPPWKGRKGLGQNPGCSLSPFPWTVLLLPLCRPSFPPLWIGGVM